MAGRVPGRGTNCLQSPGAGTILEEDFSWELTGGVGGGAGRAVQNLGRNSSGRHQRPGLLPGFN